MAETLLTPLGTDWNDFLQRFGDIAARAGMNAYLVGGPVRDLLLGTRPSDVDIMLEGDAGQFSVDLQRRWAELFPGLPVPGKPIRFRKYGTAKLPFRSPLLGAAPVLDLSSARRERYPHSGAQPIVESGTLETDLARRDFSVNAMAAALSPERWGELIDHFNGRGHLSQKVLAILHEKSFEDDPARLLRAVRFRARFDFTLESGTAALFREAAEGAYLERLPRFRLFDEFKKLLMEADPLPALELLREAKLAAQVHPQLDIDAYARVRGDVGAWEQRLGRLFSALDDSGYRKALARFELPEGTIERLVELRSVSKEDEGAPGV